MTPKTYHFCVMTQQTPGGNLQYSDGFVTIDWDLSGKAAQERLRAFIGEHMEPPCASPTILSLTVLS